MIRTAELSEKIAVAGDVYALLATGEETGGAYALVEARVPREEGRRHIRKGTWSSSM